MAKIAIIAKEPKNKFGPSCGWDSGVLQFTIFRAMTEPQQKKHRGGFHGGGPPVENLVAPFPVTDQIDKNSASYQVIKDDSEVNAAIDKFNGKGRDIPAALFFLYLLNGPCNGHVSLLRHALQAFLQSLTCFRLLCRQNLETDWQINGETIRGHGLWQQTGFQPCIGCSRKETPGVLTAQHKAFRVKKSTVISSVIDTARANGVPSFTKNYTPRMSAVLDTTNSTQIAVHHIVYLAHCIEQDEMKGFLLEWLVSKPGTIQINHTCNNGNSKVTTQGYSCVQPAHLKIGSKMENTRHDAIFSNLEGISDEADYRTVCNVAQNLLPNLGFSNKYQIS